MKRSGVWLIGARGSLATTAIAGAAAARRQLAAATGCVLESPEFPDSGGPAFGDLVFGGHDVAETPLSKRAEQLAQGGVLPQQVPDLVQADVAAAESELRTGTPTVEDGRTQAATAATLAEDLASFRTRRELDRVVVINVSSTESRPISRPEHDTLAALERALAAGESPLPPSSLYAYTAMRAGCPYVDFTPSLGAGIPALDELARQQCVPYAGSDGKTGETLVKSALAPMFATRALRVLSWSGTNLLGGGDCAHP